MAVAGKPMGAAPAGQGSGSPAPRRVKIFVIDDSNLVLEMARRVLSAAGFDVICRADPVGSTAAIMRELPDLVLIDVGMPGLNGNHLVRTIRLRQSLRHIRLVLFSSRSVAELERLVAECGADGFIEKQSGLADLPEKVRRILKTPRS